MSQRLLAMVDANPPGWRWHNFSAPELACRCCRTLRLDEAFLDRLQGLRNAYGRPLVVNSGYRCARHNQAVGATGAAGPHTTGRAVDLAMSGPEAFRLLGLALAAGFTGLGFKQHGPHATRFLHLDDLDFGPGQTRPTIWSY